MKPCHQLTREYHLNLLEIPETPQKPIMIGTKKTIGKKSRWIIHVY